MDSEELLTAWLQLGCIIDNQRLVTDLPFNEALVCGILFRAGGPLTASDLCGQTRILKSQMNVILRSLEGKGLLARRPSERDRRRVELELLPAGVEKYNTSHRHTLVLVDRLSAQLGEERTRTLTGLLTEAAQAFDQIIKGV